MSRQPAKKDNRKAHFPLFHAQVFKMQGREITTAESEALEAADTTGERMDCLHVINDKVVLDVFDTQYSCALRLVKR